MNNTIFRAVYRFILILALVLFALVSKSQETHDSPLFKFRNWNDEKIFLATSGTLILNGAFKAQADILRDNYFYFKSTFPSANDKFWNPAISYKYIPHTFAARTYWRWTKDGWHLFDTGANSMMYLACTINICNVGSFLQLKPRVIIARTLWNIGMRSIGYNSVDRLFYKHY